MRPSINAFSSFVSADVVFSKGFCIGGVNKLSESYLGVFWRVYKLFIPSDFSWLVVKAPSLIVTGGLCGFYIDYFTFRGETWLEQDYTD